MIPSTKATATIFVKTTCINLCAAQRSEEHTSELQSRLHLVCRLLLEKKNRHQNQPIDDPKLITSPPTTPTTTRGNYSVPIQAAVSQFSSRPYSLDPFCIISPIQQHSC